MIPGTKSLSSVELNYFNSGNEKTWSWQKGKELDLTMKGQEMDGSSDLGERSELADVGCFKKNQGI